MNALEIQFQPEDVLKVAERWKAQCKEDEKMKGWVGCVVIHDLCTSVMGFTNTDVLTANYRLEQSSKNGKQGVRDYLKRMVLEDVVQRAYVTAVIHLGIAYGRACDKLVEGIVSEGEVKDRNGNPTDLERITKDYYERLAEIRSYLPMTPIIEKIKPLNKDQKRLCNHADIAGDRIVYVGNRFFSQNFQRNVFFLDKDISTFFTIIRDTMIRDNLHWRYQITHPIQTKVDYMANAVEPLVWNVMEHAFNLENDVDGRTNKENFWKWVGVSGVPEKELDDSSPGCHGLKRPADSGNYVVAVNDNGFGIPQEVLPRLFERGFSTKRDKSVQHGIGLWGVKDFVERYGGRISVKTDYGKGTTFEFTIPYTRLNDFVCVQE